MNGRLAQEGPPVAFGWRLAAVIAGMAALVQTLNAVSYGWHASVPLPVSDAWYFLEGFVTKAMSGGLTVADFFAQRSAGDHAQPFQKLVLLAHLRGADLDFRVEEMVGLAGAAATASLLSWLSWRGACSSMQRTRAAIAVAAMWIVVFSTNASEIYTWSLVALGWWMVASAIGFWWLSSQMGNGLAGDTRTSLMLGLAGACLLGLAWDEVAIPVVIAAVAARLLVDRRQGISTTLVFAAAAIVGIIVARLVLARFAGDAAAEASSGSLSSLHAVVSHPDAWHALSGPLADSVIHRSHLDAWAGDWANAWQLVIAGALGLAHVAFWWRVMVTRVLPERSVAMTAVAMMLFFYACVAGVLLSRAVDFGPTYVHQQRYVLVYQLNLIALGLMFLAPVAPADTRASRGAATAVAATIGLLAFVIVQYPLARAAWTHAAYLRDYVERSALTLGGLALDPTVLPAGGCSQILTICSATVETRRKVMRMLVEHRLNVFSPAFQARHRLYPDARAQAVAARAPDCSASVLDWGPRQIVRGQGFNVQGDGRSAFWVRLAPGVRVNRLSESTQSIDFVQGEGEISFQVDVVLASKIATGNLLRFEAACPQGGSARFYVPIIEPVPQR